MEDNKLYAEKVIAERLQNFVNDNPNIVCRYEYNDIIGCYLISYILPKSINNDDMVWDKLALLKDSIESAIPNTLPLFTRDNIVFTLSSAAVTVSRQTL